MSRKFQRAKTVAERYDIDESTVWRWIKKGLLPQPIKLGPHTTGFDVSELDEYDRKHGRVRPAA